MNRTIAALLMVLWLAVSLYVFSSRWSHIALMNVCVARTEQCFDIGATTRGGRAHLPTVCRWQPCLVNTIYDQIGHNDLHAADG